MTRPVDLRIVIIGSLVALLAIIVAGVARSPNPATRSAPEIVAVPDAETTSTGAAFPLRSDVPRSHQDSRDEFQQTVGAEDGAPITF